MVSYQQEQYPECYNDLCRIRNRHSSFDLRHDALRFGTRSKSFTEDFIKLGLRSEEGDCDSGDAESVFASKPVLTATFADVEALKQQLGTEKRYGSLRRNKISSEFISATASTAYMPASLASTSVMRPGDADNFNSGLLMCKNDDKKQSLNRCSSRDIHLDINPLGSIRQKHLANELCLQKPFTQCGEQTDYQEGNGAGTFSLESPVFESQKSVQLRGFSSDVRGSSVRFQSGMFCNPRFGSSSFGDFGVGSATLDQNAATAQSADSKDLVSNLGQNIGNVSQHSCNFSMHCQTSRNSVTVEPKAGRDASSHILRKHHSTSNMGYFFTNLHHEMPLPESHETTDSNCVSEGMQSEANNKRTTCFQFPSFEEFKRMQQEKSAFAFPHRRASLNCVILEEELESQGLTPGSDGWNITPGFTHMSVSSTTEAGAIFADAPKLTSSHANRPTLHSASSCETSCLQSIEDDVSVRDTNNGPTSVDANNELINSQERKSTCATLSELQSDKDSSDLPRVCSSVCGDDYVECEVAGEGCEVDADRNVKARNSDNMLPDTGNATRSKLSIPSDESSCKDLTGDECDFDDQTLGSAISFDVKSISKEEQPESNQQKEEEKVDKQDKEKEEEEQKEEEEEEDSSKYNPDIWNFLAPSEVETTKNNSLISSSFEKEDVKCTECSESISANTEITNGVDKPVWCQKCTTKNEECRRAIREIIDTEISYGKDLGIIKHEFYEPLKQNGLLTDDQLQTIFLNLDELIMINKHFVEKFENVIRAAQQKPNEKYQTASIAQVFLDSANILMAFQTYCINQSGAPLLLDQLSQERELLRVFLEEIQKENPVLRKMDLKAFLIVPVQRVMKYPLLLERLFRVTPPSVHGFQDVVLAKKMIEETLAHINSKTIGSIKWKRRTSTTSWLNKKNILENIEFMQLSLELLGWNRYETYFVVMSRLLCVPLINPGWSQQLSSLKFQPVQCTIVTLGMMPNYKVNTISFPQNSTIRAAALVIVKERFGKYMLLREPMLLDKCIVAMDPEVPTVFEVSEMNKESLLLKAEDVKVTESWFWQLRMITKDVGRWRRRRNALANIVTHRLDNS